MTSRFLVLISAAILGCVAPSTVDRGQTRSSPLGYAAVVPAGWMAIGQKEFAGREAELESEIPHAVPDGTGNEAHSLAMEKIRTGSIEFLIPEGRGEDVYDNINVQVTPGSVPPIGTDIGAICGFLGEHAMFGPPTTFYQCNLGMVGSHVALVLESDGIYEDSVLLQYHLNHSPGKVLTVSATLRASSAESFRPAVTDFVESIEFPEGR